MEATLLISSPTKQGIESAINKYHYSTTFFIQETEKKNNFDVFNKNGRCKGYTVILKAKRFKFYMV